MCGFYMLTWVQIAGCFEFDEIGSLQEDSNRNFFIGPYVEAVAIALTKGRAEQLRGRNGPFVFNPSDLVVQNISVGVLSLYTPFDVEKVDGELLEVRKRLLRISLRASMAVSFDLPALFRRNFERSLVGLSS